MKHSEAQSIHKGAYVQSTDPGAVGAHVLWLDDTAAPVYVLKKRNAANTGWDTVYAPGSNNGLATLDGGGKIQAAQLPALAINDIFTVASQVAMLALTAQRGDVAVRSDQGKAYILAADDATVLANWVALPMPSTLPPSGTAGGDLAGSYPNPTLAILSGLVAAAYGDGTHIPVITIDTKGRITAISVVAISLTPGGDLAGDDLAHAIVNQLKGRVLNLPVPGGFLADSFPTGVIDTTLWSAAGQATQHDGAMYLVSGGVVTSNIGTPTFVDRFVSVKIHPTTQFVFRIHNGTLDGDTYIQIWIRPGEDIRVGKREAANTTWITGFGSDETPYVEANFAYLKVEHKTSTGKVHFYRSPTGAAGSWVELGSYAPSVAMTATFVQFIDLSGGGNQYIDDVDSNIPLTDPIIGRDRYLLGWDNTNTELALMRGLGVIPTTSGAPSGAPANVPAGHTLLMYDSTAHILYAWNGATWDSQAF